MPPTTNFEFGDVLLVPFPFSNQTAGKKRPAVVVSSAAYNRERQDLVILAITSQIRPTLGLGEALIADWKQAGLTKASVLKPVLATIHSMDLVLPVKGKPTRGFGLWPSLIDWPSSCSRVCN